MFYENDSKVDALNFTLTVASCLRKAKNDMTEIK